MDINNISVNNTSHKIEIYTQKLLRILRETILSNRAYIKDLEIYHLTDEGVNIFKEKIKDFVINASNQEIVDKAKAIKSIGGHDLLIQGSHIQNFFVTDGVIELVPNVIEKISVFDENENLDELDYKYIDKIKKRFCTEAFIEQEFSLYKDTFVGCVDIPWI